MEINNISRMHTQAQPTQPQTEEAANEAVKEAATDGAEIQSQQQNSAQPGSTPRENLEEALKLLGFKPSQENIGLATSLLRMGQPVNADGLRSLNRALRLTGNIREAEFLTQNAMPINTKTAGMLKNFISGEINVLEDLRGLADEIDLLPDGALKDLLEQILTGDNKQPTGGAVEKHIELSPGETNIYQSEPAVSEREIIEPLRTEPAIEPITEPITGSVTGAVKESVSEDTQVALTKAETAALPEALQKTGTEASAETLPVISTEADARVLHEAGTDTLADTLPEISGKAMHEALRQAEAEALPYTSKPEPRRLNAHEPAARDKTELPETKPHDDSIGEAKTPSKSRLFMKLLDKYAIYPETEKNGPEALNEKLSRLRDALTQAKNALPPDDRQTQLHSRLDRLERSLNFFDETQKLVYMQFPVFVGSKEQNTGLYVFRDKSKKSRSEKNAASALLSLDYACLGHLEAYIQKNGQSVNIRFSTGEDAREAISVSIEELSQRLEDKGFRLDACTFADNIRPFTLLDPEPLADGTKRQTDLINLDIKA